MLAIAVRPRALEDIVEVWLHIASDSTVHADRFVETMDRQLKLISRRPNMGRARPELGHGIRSFAIRKYVVFYVASETGIEVIRVLHGARDVGSVFESEEE